MLCCILLSDESPGSEFYVPEAYTIYADETDRVFRNVCT